MSDVILDGLAPVSAVLGLCVLATLAWSLEKLLRQREARLRSSLLIAWLFAAFACGLPTLYYALISAELVEASAGRTWLRPAFPLLFAAIIGIVVTSSRLVQRIVAETALIDAVFDKSLSGETLLRREGEVMRVERMNRSMVAWLGRSTEPVGATLAEIVPSAETLRHRNVSRLIENAHLIEGTPNRQITHDNGNTGLLGIVYAGDDRWLASVHDTTQLDLRSEQLLQALQRQERVTESLAHGLRSPAMNAQRAASKGRAKLTSGRLTLAEAGELFGRIERGMRLAVGRVDATYAYIDAGRIGERVLTPLTPLLVDLFGERVTVGELPTVSCDPVALAHALTLLVDNGLKYSAENRAPAVEIVMESNCLVVRDNGRGMTALELAALHRLHGSDNGGRGIGVLEAQQIITAHGWTMRHESKLGIGTEVFVCGF